MIPVACYLNHRIISWVVSGFIAVCAIIIGCFVLLFMLLSLGL